MIETLPPAARRASERWLGLEVVGEPPEVCGRRPEYVLGHVGRCLEVVHRIPPAPAGGRLLELGSAPYLMTLFLQEMTRYTVECANYFGRDNGLYETPLFDARSGERSSIPYRHFNVERDPFPYPDARFDVVLCCEMLEHLLLDPVRMLAEIHRVLKPSGALILTTPNVLCTDNLVRMMTGENPFQPYSGWGLYGGHCREYTPVEVRRLLQETGFEVRSLETSSFGGGRRGMTRGVLDLLATLGRWSGRWRSLPLKLRGKCILLSAVRREGFDARRREWLFRDLWAGSFIDRLMGCSQGPSELGAPSRPAAAGPPIAREPGHA